MARDITISTRELTPFEQLVLELVCEGNLMQLSLVKLPIVKKLSKTQLVEALKFLASNLTEKQISESC